MLPTESRLQWMLMLKQESAGIEKLDYIHNGNQEMVSFICDTVCYPV